MIEYRNVRLIDWYDLVTYICDKLDLERFDVGVDGYGLINVTSNYSEEPESLDVMRAYTEDRKYAHTAGTTVYTKQVSCVCLEELCCYLSSQGLFEEGDYFVRD